MSMETKNYWISDNKFIFKPEFNADINIYIQTISKFNSLIFANYDNLTILIKHDYTNNYKKEDFVYYIELKFDQCITPPPNITHLTFGDAFNKPLNLSSGLTHLTFGDAFNKPLNLPLSLTHLTLGYAFNQPLNLSNIKYLSIRNNNTHIVDNLPNSITELHLMRPFNSPLHNLPFSLKKLIFEGCKYGYCFYVHELNVLPDSLEYIELPHYYPKPILSFPKNLISIKCSKNYLYKAELENKFNYKIIYH